METAPPGKRVRLADDFAARLLDLPLGLLQVGGVDHHERVGRSDGRVLREPAAQPAILEARVVGAVVLELPAKDPLVELLRAREIRRAELDVVDPPVLISLGHLSSLSSESHHDGPACDVQNNPGNPSRVDRASYFHSWQHTWTA